MKKILILVILCSLLIVCTKNNNTGGVEERKIVKEEPFVVSVITEPPKAETAAFGTGIIVDKRNGLILTARHGVYLGDVLNYRNEKLSRNIKIVDKKHNIMDGYVVHLSLNYDLAIIKVDHKFRSQADFSPAGILKISEDVYFEGFANGQYGFYRGYIANIKKKYLDLDMNIVEGMSGGPLFAGNRQSGSAQPGIVGVVLLKQKTGGNALKSEIVEKYLSIALPQARIVHKKIHSLCLKKVELNDSNRAYILENKDAEFYFQLYVNGKEIFKSTKGIVDGDQIQWDNSADNKFNINLLPGDKIKLEVYEAGAVAFARRKSSFLGKTIHIKKSCEKLPQKGLPDLYPKIDINENTIYFEKN